MQALVRGMMAASEPIPPRKHRADCSVGCPENAMQKTLAALLLLAACAQSSQPAPTSPDPVPASPGPGEPPGASTPQPGSPAPCTAGQEWFTPAGGEGALPANGCYTRC